MRRVIFDRDNKRSDLGRDCWDDDVMLGCKIEGSFGKSRLFVYSAEKWRPLSQGTKMIPAFQPQTG